MSFVKAPTWIRYCACDGSRPAAWPSLSAWLTEREQAALAELRSPARQSQWLLGRWLSKQLIAQAAEVENFCDIEIITRSGQGLGMRPRVKLAGSPWLGSLSISHTETGVLVGVSRDEQTMLGVDLACDVPCDARFRSLWFTPNEQQWIASDPAYRTGLLWGLKEAVFKACCSGHAWTPTQIELHLESEHRFEATFFGSQLGELDVHVQRVARGLAVVVRLPHQKFPHPDFSPADRNTSSRWQTVSPTPITIVPAIAKEFVAEEQLAFALS